MNPSSSLSSESKRSSERVNVNIPVEFKGTHRYTIQARALNMSRGGMFLETSQPLSQGEKAFFRVQLGAPSLQFHLEGEVVWTRKQKRQKTGTHGMGIRFLVGPTLSQKTLDGILAILQPA